MAESERTRRIIGIYIHAGDAEGLEGVVFCTVYAVGRRIMLGGMSAGDDIAALFDHISREQLESMVEAVTSGRERVA